MLVRRCCCVSAALLLQNVAISERWYRQPSPEPDHQQSRPTRLRKLIIKAPPLLPTAPQGIRHARLVSASRQDPREAAAAGRGAALEDRPGQKLGKERGDAGR